MSAVTAEIEVVIRPIPNYLINKILIGHMLAHMNVSVHEVLILVAYRSHHY